MASNVLRQGDVITERNANNGDRTYTVGPFLGKGGFAMCYEMTTSYSFKTLAGKVVAKASLNNAVAKTKLINEIRIHRNLSHPGIVKFIHFFEDADNVYILLERCKHQSLMELVKARGRLTQPEVQYYIMQILDVLEYLKDQKVIHRDVKLGNLFLHDNLRIKMGDFGLAAKLLESEERKTTICGTPNYIAPEILDNVNGGHSFEVDVWSLGVITYTMLIGKPPFETTNLKETYSRIRANNYEYPVAIAVSASAKDIISRMLVLEPTRRASISQIRSHPFFSFAKVPVSLPISALKSNPFQNASLQMKDGLSSESNKENCKTYISNHAYLSKLKGDLATVQRAIDKSFNTADVVEENNCARECIKKQQRHSSGAVWNGCTTVVKVLNYAEKYGVGYLTSAGCIGVYFNDGTKIILTSNALTFTYYERHCDAGLVHSFQEGALYVVPTLEKKVTLLRHFRKHLLPHQVLIQTTMSSEKTVYVRKWASSKRSILFLLSNGLIQVIFADKSELAIDTRRVVRYTDKTGFVIIRYLDQGNSDEERPDMCRRLDYTRDMLNQLSR
uniref:Serine/threonine-protein kinase PLK n=1 Tax=Spongospora subterranea TaxID=70186 RepID=A0A0H5QSX7_9EUKA|eukprot:CRZ05128.1 hypothetical protein [Spongospora subterranea]